MKTTINLLLCAVFLFGSCKKSNDVEKEDEGDKKDKTEQTDQRLVGTWQNSAGNTVYEGDAKGLYLKSTTSEAWLQAIQGGFVKYGDAYIKDLEKKSENVYSCAILFYMRVDGVMKEIRYSSKTTLKFSSNGKRIDIETYNPFDNSYAETSLYKD